MSTDRPSLYIWKLISMTNVRIWFLHKKTLPCFKSIILHKSSRFIKFCKLLFFSLGFQTYKLFWKLFQRSQNGGNICVAYIDCWTALIQTTLILLRLCLNHQKGKKCSHISRPLCCACLWWLLLYWNIILYMMIDELFIVASARLREIQIDLILWYFQKTIDQLSFVEIHFFVKFCLIILQKWMDLKQYFSKSISQ